MIIRNEFLRNLKEMKLEQFKEYVLENYIAILGCDYYEEINIEYQKKYIDVAGTLDKFITNLIIGNGY